MHHNYFAGIDPLKNPSSFFKFISLSVYSHFFLKLKRYLDPEVADIIKVQYKTSFGKYRITIIHIHCKIKCLDNKILLNADISIIIT